MTYLTAKGAAAFASELKQLWRVERPEWTARVSAAAAEGDRSENAEYIYGKKKLREIDRRIRFLTKVLDNGKVVNTLPSDQSKIFFGAFVTVEDDQGEVLTVRIVGPHEADLKQQQISLQSPLAKALMGKKVDDEVEVVAPEARLYYCIKVIHYELDEVDT